MPNSSHRPELASGQKRVTYQIGTDERQSEILSQAEIRETPRDEIQPEIYQNIDHLQVNRQTNPVNTIVRTPSTQSGFRLDKDFVRYCQTYVRQTSQPETHTDMGDPHYRQRKGCCGRCGRCLSALPAGSVLAWVLLVVGVSACCGALLVGVRRTRDWLEKPDSFLQFSDIVCIAVLSGMVFLSIVFFIIATLVSSPNNREIFNTRRKNTCAYALNVVVIVVLVLLFIAWIGVTAALVVPVVAFTLLHVLYRETGIESIDLRNYGIYDESFVLSGRQLDTFYQEGLDVFTCYLIAMSGAVLTLISLCMFLMSAAANSVHLREARFSVFNAYKPELTGSRVSIVDTRM